MKINVIVLLFLLLILGGCSNFSLGGSSNTDYPSEDNTGVGLEIDFSLDDEWISQKRLDYTLIIKNSGKENIILNKENFKFRTIDKINGKYVLTEESINEFYNSIFQSEGNLNLYQNQEFGPIRGSFFIDEVYYSELTHESLTYELEAKYDYTTEFVNNLEFDLTSKNVIKLLDSLSQAAPIKVNNIDVVPQTKDSVFFDFKIKDGGPLSFSSERNIKVDSWNFYLGTNELNDCNVYSENSGFKSLISTENIRLNKDISEVVFSCKVQLGNFKSGDKTKVGGKLSYNYGIKISDKINLPKERGDSSIYN